MVQGRYSTLTLQTNNNWNTTKSFFVNFLSFIQQEVSSSAAQVYSNGSESVAKHKDVSLLSIVASD